jgi:hypothetical protein
MRTFAALPDDWRVWSDEPEGRTVLVYRPDVFDTEAYPPGCLPTLYLTKGPKDRRRPPGERRPDDDWHVTLYLEPEVAFDEQPAFDALAEAVDGAVEFAERFAAGDLDPREPYQVPREEYLDRLDELLNRT